MQVNRLSRTRPRRYTGGRGRSGGIRVVHSTAVSGPHAFPRAADGSNELFASYFGRFSLRRDGVAYSFGQGRSVLELGRYLIARAGGLVARDELAELLWPEADPSQSAHRLHVAISKLRLLLRAYLPVHFDGQNYSVPAGAVTTDCAQFDERYAHGMAELAGGSRAQGAAALQSALALYTGDYLEDARYADWTISPRSHYAERRIMALTYLCEYASAERDLAAVLEVGGRIVELDALRERAHRQLMAAHYRLGQRAISILQYRRCEEALARELNTRPSRETQRLYEAICTDTPLPVELPLLR